MKKILTYPLGVLLLFTAFVHRALGVGLENFEGTTMGGQTLKPSNLPGSKATAGGVELRASEIIQYAINLFLYNQPVTD